MMNIDGDRLWSRLMTMAEVGATDAGGSNRQALSDQDQAGRALFTEWCAAAGCSVHTDGIGNLFARRTGAGRDGDDLAPVVLGSHLDTQPTGGRFDGVYGVLGGLEVIESLNDRDITTRAPIEVAVWTNEEGSRFPVSMMGSAVWGGSLSLADARDLRDINDISVGSELDRLGWAGDLGFGRALHSYLELHIEQGPILETEAAEIGVVAGVQGLRWYYITLDGFPAHAGPTPMDQRQDPARPLGEILQGVYEIAASVGPSGRATPAQFSSEPVSPNTVPSTITFSVDLRNPDIAVLEAMETRFYELVETRATAHGCEWSIERVNASAPIHFDASCVTVVRQATEECGFDHREMTSGAGHDACNVASLAPTAMIFIPCKGGLSHNEAESIEPADAARGAEVLYTAALALAEQVS